MVGDLSALRDEFAELVGVPAGEITHFLLVGRGVGMDVYAYGRWGRKNYHYGLVVYDGKRFGPLIHENKMDLVRKRPVTKAILVRPRGK